MVVQQYGATSAKLANGETVFHNDHVYVSPPWSERDGTPYIVARIIEFLPANSTPRKNKQRSSPSDLSVRLSLYYRPSDISGRNVSDFRILLAAIHTDVQPLSNVRGKAYVRHKDKIDDLITWKKTPDHFYFTKFYDPYIKREYEVVRTDHVQNVPRHVRDILMGRYEYIVTEREMVADLTDGFRSCCICEQWASSQDSVRCEACKKNYHMGCLTPPLLNKPAKGYSWVCIPCSLQRRQDVTDKKFLFGNGNGSGNGAGAKGKANGKGKEKAGGVTQLDKTHRGWPWRYFGLYTNAEDTLDPDDSIFPRAVTRVGVKFQANVPTWEEQQAMEVRHGFGENEAGPSRHMGVERGNDPSSRNHESTIDIWCTPSDRLTSYMDDVAAMRLPVPPYDIERLDKAAQAFAQFGYDGAMRNLKSSRLPDYKPIIFTENETKIFEDQLEENGGLDTIKTGKVLGKTSAAVLRYSYIWKNEKLLAENEALRHHLKVNTSHARQHKTLGAPSLGRIRARGDSISSDDEVTSLFGEGEEIVKKGGKVQCAACSTRISDVWWRCPRTVAGRAMCETCGSNYRKYGHISFVKADDSKKVEKKEPVKKGKNDAGSGASTPIPPPPPPKLPPCACCRRMEPKSTMARCKTCTFSAHAGCYGIPPEQTGPNWECELCANVRLEENHLEPRCVLCPRDISGLAKRSYKRPGVDFDLLSVLKPTEGRRWAHTLCAGWVEGVMFTSKVGMKDVEGVVSISADKWEEACTLCGQGDGAVVGCGECHVRFHPSCAWSSGHRFGFEFSLAKPGKKEVVTITRFKESEGVMSAMVWCKGHDMEGRVIYDMHEMDPDQNETAMQIYVASYKAIPPDESFALLRKARRLDEHLTSTVTVKKDKECRICGIDVSPKWHPDQGQLVCHQCYFRI